MGGEWGGSECGMGVSECGVGESGAVGVTGRMGV